MAYMCIRSAGFKECDGCGWCTNQRPSEPETGVTIEATITLRFTAYGEIEAQLRHGEDVEEKAEELVKDIIECCGIAGKDMKIDSVDYELND